MRFTLAFLLALFVALPEAALAQGIAGHSILLVASRKIDDPHFQQSVVLVTRHGRSAPIGVIINRPLDKHLGDALPNLPGADKQRLHLGGPVAPNRLVFLFRGDSSPPGTIEVIDKVFFGQQASLLGDLLAGKQPQRGLRVFAGMAGWAPGQLENEIARGDWFVLPVDAAALFERPPESLWPELYRRATQTTAQGGALPPMLISAAPIH
jgi:putative transcriptional regulator